jgi:hypothetical protein
MYEIIKPIDSENINTSDNTYINPNIVNIDGLTICHKLLYNSKNVPEELIKKTNLNIQDNLGNTILFLLVHYDIWKKYINILQSKKLNIYIKNKNDETVLDILKISDKKDFDDLLIRSYHNYLMKHPNNWINNMDNNCSANTDLSNECYLFINSVIKKGIAIPLQNNKYTISMLENPKISINTFMGSNLDILCGMSYLEKKHNISTLHTDNINIPKEIELYLDKIGIIENNYQHIGDISIRWIYQKIFYPANFIEQIKSAKDIIIIHISIVLSNGSHSNILYINKQKNIVERFEPHGSSYPYNFNYNPKLLDNLLHNKFKNILNEVTYISPSEYLPRIGFQILDISETMINKNIGDPSGFCTLWCIWYMEYRLKYENYDSNKIIKYLFRRIKMDNRSFREIIRNYSVNITNYRDELLNNIGQNINSYISNQLSEVDRNKILISIN